jgi:hypothetical protein
MWHLVAHLEGVVRSLPHIGLILTLQAQIWPGLVGASRRWSIRSLQSAI